ncbi:hypothetical protein QL285_088068 [Trifolium repens]|nr:hypothetical protein QL285_088068 [Trifolium repens]
MSDGSFRVKRICVEPRIIEKLCAEGPFNTPSKGIAKAVDLEGDSHVDDLDDDDSMPLAFLKNIIVTPSSAGGSKTTKFREVAGSVKRSLSEDFNEVAKIEVKKRARILKKDK